jgi:hypothetical protein
VEDHLDPVLPLIRHGGARSRSKLVPDPATIFGSGRIWTFQNFPGQCRGTRSSPPTCDRWGAARARPCPRPHLEKRFRRLPATGVPRLTQRWSRPAGGGVSGPPAAFDRAQSRRRLARHLVTSANCNGRGNRTSPGRPNNRAPLDRSAACGIPLTRKGRLAAPQGRETLWRGTVCSDYQRSKPQGQGQD